MRTLSYFAAKPMTLVHTRLIGSNSFIYIPRVIWNVSIEIILDRLLYSQSYRVVSITRCGLTKSRLGSDLQRNTRMDSMIMY